MSFETSSKLALLNFCYPCSSFLTRARSDIISLERLSALIDAVSGLSKDSSGSLFFRIESTNALPGEPYLSVWQAERGTQPGPGQLYPK